MLIADSRYNEAEKKVIKLRALKVCVGSLGALLGGWVCVCIAIFVLGGLWVCVCVCGWLGLALGMYLNPRQYVYCIHIIIYTCMRSACKT